MKLGVIALGALAVASVATEASAQVLNLSGQYQCIQGCMPPNAAPAFVTQNGWDLNLVNEIGQPSSMGRLSRAHLGGVLARRGGDFPRRSDHSIR